MRLNWQTMSKSLRLSALALKCARIGRKYRAFTMIPRLPYISNLLTAAACRGVDGCVVECGVWRGGMMAGLAEVLGRDRHYYLFDSFEGLPPPTEMDGSRAQGWSNYTKSVENDYGCKAELHHAQQAMAMSKARHYQIIPGWFSDTIPPFVPAAKIALLRLDADWYESTWLALNHLYKYMAPEGIIIIDDYYCWDGCSRAVHKFIADNGLPARIDRCFGYTCILRLYQGVGWDSDCHPHRRWFAADGVC